MGASGEAIMADAQLEAVKLIADWAKWLVTIETAGLAVIGGVLKAGDNALPISARVCLTMAVSSFVVSIAAAAFFLLSLPEITERLSGGHGSVWLREDSVIGIRLQTLAIVESLFFGVGVVAFAGMILAMVWTAPTPRG
jgi:hypothetical protein